MQRLVATGVLWRLQRGWFTVADPTLDAKALHLRRARAVVRGRQGRSLASHHTALLCHGLPVFNVDLTTVHTTYRTGAVFRHRRGVVSHAADVSTRLDRCPVSASVVGIPFAVVQAGMVSGPLATLVAADCAVHEGRAGIADIAEAAASYRFAPGIASVAAIIGDVDGRSESPPESLARYALRRLGFEPVPQLPVHTEGHTYRADLALEKERVIIEVDGAVKYAGADAAVTVMNEKRRHAALQRAGWVVIRITWHELVSPLGTLRLDNLAMLLESALRTRV